MDVPVECYLCGAENSPEADFCYRCDGQLLKIGVDPEDNDEPTETAEDELMEFEEETAKSSSGRSRMGSLRSAEHRRLHDALGLDGDEEHDDKPALIPTVAPTPVPMIGTRPGAFTSTHAEQQGISRPAVFMLTLLAALVGILGYRTVTKTEPAEPPPEIAFSDSTLPLPPEDTTPELRPWTQNELIGKFAPTFVTVLLYDCPAAERYVTTGVVVDERNVLFAPGDAPEIDAIVILSNLGNRGLAYYNRHESGAHVATTWRSLSRTIELTDSPEGEESFLISRDLNSSTTAVGDSSDPDADDDATSTSTTTVTGEPTEALTITVASSSQGDPLAIGVGTEVYELDALQDIARYRSELVEGANGDVSNVCAAAETIVPATPVEAPPTTVNPRGDITVAET